MAFDVFVLGGSSSCRKALCGRWSGVDLHLSRKAFRLIFGILFLDSVVPTACGADLRSAVLSTLSFSSGGVALSYCGMNLCSAIASISALMLCIRCTRLARKEEKW